MLEKILKLAVFVGLLFVAMTVFPFLATHESYDKANTVNRAFPFAVLDNGKPSIVTWSQYERDRTHYTALVADAEKEYSLNEVERFVLTPDGNNNFRVDLHADDYRYWSARSIQIRPRPAYQSPSIGSESQLCEL